MLEFFLQHVWEVSICGVIILVAFYIWLCAGKIYKLNAAIKKVLAASEFVDELEKSSLLAPAWTAFKKTLTEEKYSTTDAAEFFNQQSLTRGMNMTFWQAYGGIFTGLGILGTFAGLTFGLSGVDMTSGNVETLKSSIAQLLSGVETAFVTSLVGIGAALVYSGIHHWLLKNFQGNVQRLASRLDEQFPRYSAENFLADIKGESQNQTAELKNIGGQAAIGNSWLEKNNIAAQNQTAELQTIGTDIKNIGEQVAEAIYAGLDEKLGAYVDKICAAIETLGEGGNNKLGEIISDRVGSQMDRFSVALDNFSNSIDEKLKSANEISKIMNEQLLNTLKALDETLNQHAKTSADERDAEYKKFSDALENLIKTLQDVEGKIKTQQEDTAKDFETLLKNALDNFNAVMAQMLKDAEGNREKDNQQRQNDAKQNQKTNEQFLSTLAGLSKTLKEVADNSKQQQKTSADNFDALIRNLIGKLEKFTEQQKEFLNNVATSNAAQISEAVKNFRAIVDAHNETTQKMFAQVQSQLSETEKFLQQVNAAGTSLKQAAEPVKQSTQQLTKNLSETSAQLNNLATANRTTRDNLFNLTIALRDFTDKFNGIAKELETSTNVIKNSLEHYNYEMSKGLSDALTKFDSNMDKSVSHLQSMLENLTDALEDLKKIRGR